MMITINQAPSPAAAPFDSSPAGAINKIYNLFTLYQGSMATIAQWLQDRPQRWVFQFLVIQIKYKIMVISFPSQFVMTKRVLIEYENSSKTKCRIKLWKISPWSFGLPSSGFLGIRQDIPDQFIALGIITYSYFPNRYQVKRINLILNRFPKLVLASP